MKLRKIDLALGGLALLPLGVTAAVYRRLPEQVPIHWNLDGSVNYGGRETLWPLAAMALGLLLLFRILPKIDPRRENYSRFRGAYDMTILATLLILNLLCGITVVEALRPGTVSVERVVTCAVGIFMAVLGNVMPKFKSNFFAGARTPWTLSDPDVWNRTQRLTGRLFFVWGILLAGGGLLLPGQFMFAVMIAGVAVVLIVPTAMSYRWYREKQKDRS